MTCFGRKYVYMQHEGFFQPSLAALPAVADIDGAIRRGASAGHGGCEKAWQVVPSTHIM
jgi:hypothetical protein